MNTFDRAAMRDHLLKKILAAVPSDEQCLEDEDNCFAKHPIHPAQHDGNGRLTQVYADLDGLVDLVTEGALEYLAQLTIGLADVRKTPAGG